MARTLSLVPIILILLLVQMDFCAESHAVKTADEGTRLGAASCQPKCAYRCSKASRRKMCIRACNTCCRRCGCVPPGTSGNYDVCPCYASLKTHGGRRKCP